MIKQKESRAGISLDKAVRAFISSRLCKGSRGSRPYPPVSRIPEAKVRQTCVVEGFPFDLSPVVARLRCVANF